jgi:hypothetical protein
MKQWICLEFHGTGDPYFGGSADDRPLGADGKFLVRTHSRADYAFFNSKSQALDYGKLASNKRPGGKLSAIDIDVDANIVRRSRVVQRRHGMTV